MGLTNRIKVARGEEPAQLVLRNANLVNVVTGEIYPTDIVIQDTYIAAVGEGYEGKNEIDLKGRYVCPGFIDAHVHIESSLCTPPQFARAVLAHGVTTAITDPHEIANVLGLEGVRFMLERAKSGMMSIFVMAPSCVPATPMETSGARLEAIDLMQLLTNQWVLGLGEMMNYPGVVLGDKTVLDKITLFKGRILDGHSPNLTGKPLNAYVAAGIQSDHECTTIEEAREKLRLGMTIFIREGTETRDLQALLPVVTPENHSHICFCTDDRVPASLIDEGSIDYIIREAIKAGLDPMMAIRMGTINPARHFGLRRHGVIAPNYRADLVVFSDLRDLRAEMVFRGGILVAEDGEIVVDPPSPRRIDLRGTINVQRGNLDFRIPANGKRIRVIGHIPDQVVTNNLIEDAKISNGYAVTDVERDLLKIAVVERHQATGNMGKGFIKGFGLKRGAIAGTIAHDHHNLVVIGADDASMRTAAEAVIDMRGGLVIVDGDKILGKLPLPVAGLMSEEPIAVIRRAHDALTATAHELGSTVHDPFMAMSFMGLEVIPSLKLTDIGLIDVEQFAPTELFV